MLSLVFILLFCSANSIDWCVDAVNKPRTEIFGEKVVIMNTTNCELRKEKIDVRCGDDSVSCTIQYNSNEN